jgi:hypothetical protein
MIKMNTGKVPKSIFEGKKIITFDTETFRIKQENSVKISEIQPLAYYSIYDGENYFNGTMKEEFIEHIRSLKNKYKHLLIFAHNLAYDLTALDLMLDFMKDKSFLGITAKIKMMSSVVYFQFENKRYSIEFIDSFNFFKTKLKNLAKDISTDKVYQEYDYSLSADVWTLKLRKEVENKDYSGANQDAKILYDYISNMEANKNILWGISAASSSFRTWSAKYNRYDIDLVKFNEIALKTYKGGRNELYNNNHFDNVIDVDINSLYPFVMQKYKYSIKFKKEFGEEWLKPDIIYKLINEDNYNYLLNIDYWATDKIERLPILVKASDKLIQINNAKDIWITGLEFKALYETGASIIVNRCLAFYHADLFSKYVDDFYKLKQSSKGSERSFYKLMLNSLYGKFGQHKATTEFVQYDDEDFDYVDDVFNETRNWLRLKLKEMAMENLERSKDDIQVRFNFNEKYYNIYPQFFTYQKELNSEYPILIAAEITAAARIENYNRQKELGFGNVIYTDTDSFFVDVSKKNEELSKVLNKYMYDDIGGWKIENSGSFIGYGPKNYEFTDKDGNVNRKLKGIKKNAKVVGPDLYVQDIIQSFKNSFSAHSNVVISVKKKDSKRDTKFKWKNNVALRYNNIEEYEEIKRQRK